LSELNGIGASSRAFGDGAFYGVTGDALFFGDGDGGSEASIKFRTGSTEASSDLNFAGEFAYEFAFLE
jgi:hypothetical protein